MRKRWSALAAVLSGLVLSTAPAVVAVAEETAASDALKIERFGDVPYLVDPDGATHVLSVYAPTEPGPWPTAVMIHGGGGSHLDHWARTVAAEGAVVFVPYWQSVAFPWPDAAAAIAEIESVTDQLACAMRFARSEAGRYGGDPADVSLFGHSAGANHASYIALADPPVSPDCLAGADSAIPEDLVLFEGDWLLMGDPVWDSVIAEDLSVLRVGTPWSYLADGPRIPVTIVDSGDSSLAVRTQEQIDRSLAIRDPDGVYRDGLDRAAALEDEQLTMTDGQHLLADELSGLGYPVDFVDLPGSTHGYLSDTALEMIADALMSGSAEHSSVARD